MAPAEGVGRDRILRELPRAKGYYSMSVRLTRDEVREAYESFFALGAVAKLCFEPTSSVIQPSGVNSRINKALYRTDMQRIASWRAFATLSLEKQLPVIDFAHRLANRVDLTTVLK
ncbi:MAG: hypothetical protein ACPLPR_06510 [Bacillota bacterium]